MEKLTDPEIEKFTKLLSLISQKLDVLGETVRSTTKGITPLESRLSRLEHNRNVKRSATPMSCEVKFNVLPPENPEGFSKTITATNSPRIQCLRGQKTIPGDEDPDKTITIKIITSGDVVSELSESTLEDSPVIQKSEECRQQEMIQTGCVAEEGELMASDNDCGTSVLYKIKRTEGECPQGDIQSENSTPGILSEILHENSNDLGELHCDSVADFSDSVRLSGTTAAIQLDGTELDAPWKCDKAKWSKHPEVGAGNPTERDRALDALWKSDDNVCDAEVARNVSAPSSAMQAEEMCQECVPFIFVPSPDKVQIKQPPPRKSSTDLETATGSDTSRRFKKFTALCVVGTKEPRFEGLGKREPLEQDNGKPREEKRGHDMDSVDQVDESTVKIGDLKPRRGRKRRKRNTNDHNPLYTVATECSQGEFKISDGSIVGSEIWPPSCGEPPPCARQRDQSMASALVESGKKARVEMWFCKQGLVLTLPLRFREADDPHVARDVREIKGPPISPSGEISLFGTKRIEKGAVKRCSREIEEKTWGSQERRYAGAPSGKCGLTNSRGGGGRRSAVQLASPWGRDQPSQLAGLPGIGVCREDCLAEMAVWGKKSVWGGFNSIISYGVVAIRPNIWYLETSREIKKWEAIGIKNYFLVAISLLPAISKLFERIVLRRLRKSLEEKNPLRPEQFGYQAKHSTLHQLVVVTEKIRKAMDLGQITGAVFFDIAKAFDKVWHEALLYKMCKKHLPGDIIKITQNFLTNRTFKVRVKNELSTARNILAGVPQGSVTGPTLFDIFIDDFPCIEDTSLHLFADDTAILASTYNFDNLHMKLQEACIFSTLWCKEWRVTMNPQKSEAIIFSRKKEKIKKPLDELFVFEDNIKWKENIRYLGMTLDEHLTFKKHIENRINLAKAAQHRLSLLLGPKSKLSLHCKRTIYTSIIRPILIYGHPIFMTAHKTILKKLEVFENKMIRKIMSPPCVIKTRGGVHQHQRRGGFSPQNNPNGKVAGHWADLPANGPKLPRVPGYPTKILPLQSGRGGHFPRQWKEGRLILLPKSSNSATSQLEKYRPITLLNTMAKVFERCILARLQRLADRHVWFFEDQYKTVLGTVNGRSVEDALASITQLIEERQAHWWKTLVISSDISKAFDTVWRPAIIQNLERLNCSESITCLVKSFLEDRTVSYSAWTATECTSSQLGTPQGSALSPFLWNIVARTIFTLPSIIDSRLIAYADDFTLMTQLDGASAWGGRALSSEGIRQLRSLHCNFAKRVLRGGPYTPTVSAISITGSPPFDIIVRSRTAFLKEINEGNFESRPGPASSPYPPDRRQLSFSLNIEEITTPIIFTDGSKNEAGVGAAIVPSSEDQQPVLLRLHPDCTAFQAELLAIRWAVRLVKEGYSRNAITIASDCRSALSAICTSGPVRSTLVAKIILALNTNQNVNLCWVPGHCGIDGKERADRAAKNAAVLILEPSFSILPRSLARNHSRAAALDAWTEVYCQDHYNRHLRRIAHTPDRLLQFLPKVSPGEVTTTLLTGHGHVRADLALWRLGEDPSCPHCMEEQQTVDHLLFRCPAFKQHRMKTALLLGKTSFDPVSLAGLPESSTEALRAFRNFKGIRRGKGPMSCYSLRRMIKNFEKTGSLEAKPRSGRPSTRKSVAVTVSQNVEAIETLSTYGE
ncbi:hypothetical protein LAZ67_7001841, partial [Cordylochernes scorpioides]